MFQNIPSRRAIYGASSGGLQPVEDQGYRFCSNRQRPSYVFVAASAGSRFTVAEQVFYTGKYAVQDLRVCFTNFVTPQTGTAPFEVVGDPGGIMQGIRLKVAGTRYALPMNGGDNYTWDSKPWIWTDPGAAPEIPPYTQFSIINTDDLAVGIRRPCGYNPISAKFGDRGGQGTTTQAGFLTTGTVPTPTFGLLCRGPYAIIGKLVGLDTNIFLANGDSLMAGGTTDASNQNGARANIGYFPIGMDDSTGIGSIPFGMFAVGSTNMDAISPANYALRERMLREVGYPFDDHVTNHVNNSVTGQGPDILNQRRMKSYSYMRQMRHVGKRPPRIIQITPNPLAQETDATKQWTDPATQSVTAPNALPDGERWVVRDMILANKGNDDHVDVTPYWADTTFPDRWKAPGRIYTVVSDVSSGVVLRITGSIRPRQGDFMIVGVGASGWVRKTIGAVADVTPGSVWDVTSATGQTAYAPTVVAGTAVAMALTSDGIHDGSPGNEDASAAIIAAKNSGILS